MFRIPCPHCGLRNLSEFRHLPERGVRPDPSTAAPGQWRGYLYDRNNAADWTVETWFHSAGCRRYLIVERHTMTNDVRPVSG